MNNILKLIIDDYCNQKPSAEHRLIQRDVCEAQTKFMARLNKKQRKKFLELDSHEGKLNAIAQDDLVEYLFRHLRNL